MLKIKNESRKCTTMKEQYRINSIEDLTPELVLSLVKEFQSKEVPRYNRLFNYYIGESDIKKRQLADGKPNNRLQTPYAQYISSTILGYFLGKPISYSSQKKDLMENVQYIYDLNNEQTHNANIGKDQSVYGIAYELMYLNEQGDVSFTSISPKESFVIYDTSIVSKKLAFVRFYTIKDYVSGMDEMFVEVYTGDTISSYKLVVKQITKDETQESLDLFAEEVHYFDEVPVSVFKNNPEKMADFEKVIDLINAYDLTLSDQQNAIDYFSDSYLVISGMDIDQEGLTNIKRTRVIVVDEKGKAEFLTKDATSQGMQEYLEQLQSNIHTYSFVPNLADVNFSGMSSGESLKYKLINLENSTSIKERHFKEGLNNRLKLIVNHLNLKGNAYAYDEIQPTFTRNLPANIQGEIELVSKLNGIVSKKTLLSQLSFIDDVAYEEFKLAEENQDTLNEFGSLEVGE